MQLELVRDPGGIGIGLCRRTHITGAQRYGRIIEVEGGHQ
jgi:hypothetical protein